MERQAQSPAPVMRILKYAFVVSAFLFILVMKQIPVQPGPPMGRKFEAAIAFVGLVSVVVGFLVPRFVFQAAQRTPRKDSTAIQLQQWITKGVMSLAFFEACILFGLALHFLHGSVRLVELMFTAGIAAELFWSPGKPPSAENGEFPQG